MNHKQKIECLDRAMNLPGIDDEERQIYSYTIDRIRQIILADLYLIPQHLLSYPPHKPASEFIRNRIQALQNKNKNVSQRIDALQIALEYDT